MSRANEINFDHLLKSCESSSSQEEGRMSNITSHKLFMNLDEIGLQSLVQPLLDRLRNETSGLILITGQRATGKTTTLFSFALEASGMGLPVSVVAGAKVRKDVESHVTLPEGLAMHGVAESTEEAWTASLQAALKDQESVIIITELDMYNARTAIDAVSQGRWVFACVNTPFVGMDVAYNLRALGLTHQEILGHVSGIVSQMFFPKLCQACAESIMADVEEARLVYPNIDTPQTLWREVGCEQCDHQGTRGRCVAYGILLIDDETRPMLEESLEKTILPTFPTGKYAPIQHAARELVKHGKLGINTYTREVFHNPLLRMQHLWEQEQQRSTRIKRMFERFVTNHVAEQIISQKDFERIVNGERRRVTCFFADIRGFTTRSESASPIDIFRLSNAYFRDMIEIIVQYNGTIDKFTGDGIMVAFGAPIEQHDHALRAVQCAIAIQHKIADINQHSPDISPVEMGIGINSGDAAAGCLGNDRRMDYTVFGDTVNIAARLESQAKPGQILCGPETCQAVRDKIQCQNVGPLRLKGKTEMLDVYEVLYSSQGHQ